MAFPLKCLLLFPWQPWLSQNTWPFFWDLLPKYFHPSKFQANPFFFIFHSMFGLTWQLLLNSETKMNEIRDDLLPLHAVYNCVWQHVFHTQICLNVAIFNHKCIHLKEISRLIIWYIFFYFIKKCVLVGVSP